MDNIYRELDIEKNEEQRKDSVIVLIDLSEMLISWSFATCWTSWLFGENWHTKKTKKKTEQGSADFLRRVKVDGERMVRIEGGMGIQILRRESGEVEPPVCIEWRKSFAIGYCRGEKSWVPIVVILSWNGQKNTRQTHINALFGWRQSIGMGIV